MLSNCIVSINRQVIKIDGNLKGPQAATESNRRLSYHAISTGAGKVIERSIERNFYFILSYKHQNWKEPESRRVRIPAKEVWKNLTRSGQPEGCKCSFTISDKWDNLFFCPIILWCVSGKADWQQLPFVTLAHPAADTLRNDSFENPLMTGWRPLIRSLLHHFSNWARQRPRRLGLHPVRFVTMCLCD